MNERIQELAEQCRSYWKSAGGITYPHFDHRKFAELIVRECASTAEKWYSDYPSDDRSVSEAVKQHFGVE